jgi:hypothetical protein
MIGGPEVTPAWSLERALAALLDGTAPADPSPAWEVVEHVLTAGYAEVLDLEAERVQLQHRLQLAMGDDGESGAPAEVATITDAIRDLQLRVAALRSRLVEVDRRHRAPLLAADGALSPSPGTA